ncbi:MAG: hypothetical protein O2816_16970 [Planctomycetota bacterium]|nr:hypothetical protein [Planctomycetota bacterium]
MIVEDVVAALTGAPDQVEGGSRQTQEGLGQHLQRAAEEFDKRTADAFGRALLDSLCEDPGNLRQLEALIVLGLAHPDVLERHRISLAVEGRRLAVLLERAGEIDRARGVLELLGGHMPGERTIDHELAGILRRSGNTDELVERYLRRAEREVEEGKVSQAIPWLQEILLLDRTRRDVARMIRDLRYQEADRQQRKTKRNRLLIVVVLLSACLTAVLGREVRIHRDYGELVKVEDGDPDSLYRRKQGIERLLAEHRFWAGFLSATAERDSLTERIASYEREAARRTRASEAEEQRRTEMADAARMRALMYSERGDFARALQDFEKALFLSSENWTHREQVEADIAAIRNWKAQGAKAK